MLDCATQCALRFANRRRAWYTWRNLTKLPNPLGRAGRNRRASPTQTREKRRNGAAWAPILMFARGRAGAKGDLWSGILVCGHPVTGHPRATHLVHTLVHRGPHARKSSIRSMIRQFVLERPAKYFAPSTVRPLARDLWVLVGWPFPLGFGLDGRLLLLARRGRVYV